MSRIEAESVGFRDKLIAKNDYGNDKEYNVSHPDALSTGDAQGKGEVNGNIGNNTDIQMRAKLIAKNAFTPNREYDSSNA